MTPIASFAITIPFSASTFHSIALSIHVDNSLTIITLIATSVTTTTSDSTTLTHLYRHPPHPTPSPNNNDAGKRKEGRRVS